MKTIGYSAFSGCDNLEYILIPDTVEIIDYHAFSWCVNLKYVRIS